MVEHSSWNAIALTVKLKFYTEIWFFNQYMVMYLALGEDEMSYNLFTFKLKYLQNDLITPLEKLVEVDVLNIKVNQILFVMIDLWISDFTNSCSIWKIVPFLFFSSNFQFAKHNNYILCYFNTSLSNCCHYNTLLIEQFLHNFQLIQGTCTVVGVQALAGDTVLCTSLPTCINGFQWT